MSTICLSGYFPRVCQDFPGRLGGIPPHNRRVNGLPSLPNLLLLFSPERELMSKDPAEEEDKGTPTRVSPLEVCPKSFPLS